MNYYRRIRLMIAAFIIMGVLAVIMVMGTKSIIKINQKPTNYQQALELTSK